MPMAPAELLASLKARFAGGRTARITINADEIAEWPAGAFDRFTEAKLLKQIEPAQALECRGCEEACFMPVNVLVAEAARPARAFILCVKRQDVGRVRVEFGRLHQWQMSREGFERLQAEWIGPATGARDLRKVKAPLPFRSALEGFLAEIERRAAGLGLPFDRKAMPGRKVDLQAVAEKFDGGLEFTARTFDDYLEGLCAFKRGARKSDFYQKVFPEYFK